MRDVFLAAGCIIIGGLTGYVVIGTWTLWRMTK